MTPPLHVCELVARGQAFVDIIVPYVILGM